MNAQNTHCFTALVIAHFINSYRKNHPYNNLGVRFFLHFFAVRGNRQIRAHACFMHCPKSNYAVIVCLFFFPFAPPPLKWVARQI